MEAPSPIYIPRSDSNDGKILAEISGIAVTDYAELGLKKIQTDSSSEHEKLKPSRKPLSTLTSVVVITQLVGISFIISFSNGIIAVGLPTIAAALDITSSTLLWPSSIGFLTTGTFLLLGGALADVAGPKRINLLGCAFLVASTVAMGFSQQGMHLIVCRALQGIAFALAYPSSVSIISIHLERGKVRNVGFACLGFSMVFGFMSGLFVGAVEWRTGFYLAGALGFILSCVGAWSLPHDRNTLPEPPTLRSIARDIDWTGAAIACSCLALISTFLALLAADTSSITRPLNICLLVISLMLAPTFVFWMHWQEKRQRPALIPNSVWTTNGAFTCICLMMMIAGAVQNCMEILCSLFFQNIQGVSAIGTALRILPTSIMGCILNLVTGRLIHHARPIYPALITTVVCTASPLIMALINPAWPYWYAGFWGVMLSALTGDVIYTIGLLISADAFPERMQGLAGALFNVFYMLGSSIGLTIVDVILSASNTSEDNGDNGKTQMSGLRISFWTLFAMTAASAVLGGIGLRKLGRIGLSQDATKRHSIPRRASH